MYTTQIMLQDFVLLCRTSIIQMNIFASRRIIILKIMTLHNTASQLVMQDVWYFDRILKTPHHFTAKGRLIWCNKTRLASPLN